MGGSPPSKPAATRARRNKTSTNTVLTALPAGSVKAPQLPRGLDWHPMVRLWWRDIWRSPMAPEYDDSDIHGLYGLAMVVNDFWTADNRKDRIAASAEMRLQAVRYGLSPMDRRRLQWEIEKTEEAKDRGAKRRRDAAASQERPNGTATPPGAGVDPRDILRSA